MDDFSTSTEGDSTQPIDNELFFTTPRTTAPQEDDLLSATYFNPTIGTKEEEVSIPETPHASAFDAAEAILRRMGEMSTMKLQKLVYYCQVWSLVWDELPLFNDEIEAWANGPVVRRLFNYHRGMFSIGRVITGNPDLLNESQIETIEAVLKYYGDKNAQWLIDLSHREFPWQHTRRGMVPTERGTKVIPLDLIADYYSSLPS